MDNCGVERDMGMLRGVCVPVAWSVGLWSVGLVASERCVVGRALHVCRLSPWLAGVSRDREVSSPSPSHVGAVCSYMYIRTEA